MNIVYGGSFNPVTTAHVKIIELLLKKYNPEFLIIVPVGNNSYHKDYLEDFDIRVKMLKLCVDKYKNVIISDIEKDKFKGTYFTLSKLGKKYKDIHFALGSDNALNLGRWIKYDKLVEKYPFIIINRNQNVFTSNNKLKYEILDENFEGSSTIFRTTFNKDFVTKEVYDYIYANNLYNIKGGIINV